MDKATSGKTQNGEALVPAPIPQSVKIAQGGIRTSRDASNFLSSLVTDLMTKSVSIREVNGACNAMGKLLKVAEMERKYAKPEGPDNAPIVLANLDLTCEAKEAKKRILLEELAALQDAGI